MVIKYATKFCKGLEYTETRNRSNRKQVFHRIAVFKKFAQFREYILWCALLFSKHFLVNFLVYVILLTFLQKYLTVFSHFHQKTPIKQYHNVATKLPMRKRPIT